jgi:hypothetical protein
MIDILPIIAGIEGEWVEHCGRKVFQHRIHNTQYMPGSHPAVEAGVTEESEWYLMIETDGRTWIWDGWIMEG